MYYMCAYRIRYAYIYSLFAEQIYHAIPCMGEGKHCQRVISFASMARTILYQTPSKFGRLTYAYDPTDVCKAPPCVYGGSVGDR